MSRNLVNFSTVIKQVFNDNDSSCISSLYDEKNDKIVISYRDHGYYSFGKSISGTIDKSKIIFDAPVIFSESNVPFTSSVYDHKTGNIIIAYRDYLDNDRGKVVVGSISSRYNSILFGSPVTFCRGIVDYIDVCINEYSGKVIIAYHDGKDRRKGKVVAGYTFGNTIVIGNEFIFSEGVYANYNKIISDHLSNRFFIFFRDGGDSGRGKMISCVVKGRNIKYEQVISFESTSVFSEGIVEFISPIFLPHEKKIFIAYNYVDSTFSENKLPFKSITRRLIPIKSKETRKENGMVFIGELKNDRLIPIDLIDFVKGEINFVSTTYEEHTG
jgi:hypothetical protein